MKKSNYGYYHSAHYCPAYPNEADTNYYRQKLLNIGAGLFSGAALTWTIVILASLM